MQGAEATIATSRRKFVTAAVSLVAGAGVVGTSGWLATLGTRGWQGTTIQVKPGTVTIVEFAADGSRLGPTKVARVAKTKAAWRRQLSPLAFAVTRQQATEVPFSGPLNNVYRPGLYRCVCCATPVFGSAVKYDANDGWPSFWKPLAAQNIWTRTDRSLGMVRTEVRCRRCDGHLGHLFDDGPRPTGERYCINSAALTFVPFPAKT